MTTEWYSGFYNVSSTRHLHFVLVESQNDPKTDPLIVYFSGGPGTPSINMVFDSGVGPVMNGPNDTFVASPNTWCRNASVLFEDNPAGIGYSYAHRMLDYPTSDYQTAKDALRFILQFYLDYPEYLGNPLYLFGVSYGGIYAPLLGLEIHRHNLEVDMLREDVKIPLKGFVISNGATDYRYTPNIDTVKVASQFNMIPRSI